MSYEPTQPPDSGNTPPYGTPPQGLYTPPQGPYPPPPEVYSLPPQGSYTPPQQGPYGVIPLQGPGGPPSQGPYDSAPAATAPLPLGEAIRQLPSQYIKVLTKPSARTFAAEMGKAAWNIVWVQLIGLAIIATVLGYLGYLINPGGFTSSSLSPGTVQTILLSEIVIVPLGFFIFVGIVYLVAKVFGGQGTFLAQGYCYLLVTVPIGIIGGVLGSVPFVGVVATYALVIYAFVLDIFYVMAVHRLGGGKATAVVFIAFGALIFIGVIIAVIVVISIRPA